MKIFNVLLVLFTILLVGCSSPREKLSREDWMEVRNHYYANVSKNEVLESAEEIFRLADESDISFSYNNDSLKAIRWAAPFPINIWYHWDITTLEEESGTEVNVSISTTASGFAVPGGMNPHDSPDVIKLFYKRLDYLLGINDEWPTCDKYEKSNSNTTTLEALCMLTEDLLPSSISKQ